MGVAHKMSSDEPVVISFAKLAKMKRGKVRQVNANDESAENERTPSPDDPVFNPEDSKEGIDCIGVADQILKEEKFPAENDENSPSLLDQSIVKSEDGFGSLPDSQDGSRTFENLDSFPETSESKRKRGRPSKKLEPVSISLDESRQSSLTESENFEESNLPKEEDSEMSTKRTRTRPNRFVPDVDGSPKLSKRVQDETSSDSSLVPAKKRRGRPPKSDLAGTPTIVPASDIIKDPIEEDLSESSSDVAWFVNSESKLSIPTETSACPSPAPSSASSSIGSCSESPLRLTGSSSVVGSTSQKRTRGRPRLNHTGERLSAIANFAQVSLLFRI